MHLYAKVLEGLDSHSNSSHTHPHPHHHHHHHHSPPHPRHPHPPTPTPTPHPHRHQPPPPPPPFLNSEVQWNPSFLFSCAKHYVHCTVCSHERAGTEGTKQCSVVEEMVSFDSLSKLQLAQCLFNCEIIEKHTRGTRGTREHEPLLFPSMFEEKVYSRAHLHSDSEPSKVPGFYCIIQYIATYKVRRKELERNQYRHESAKKRV